MRRDQLKTRVGVNLLLTLVGVVAATWAIWSFDRAIGTGSVSLMGSRQAGVQAAIDVMKEGGPPLTGSGVPFGEIQRGTSGGFYPAGSGDDPGIYLYLPVLGQILGIDDPGRLMKIFFLALMGAAFGVLPLGMYHATGSTVFAALSPFLARHTFSFVENSDVYWITAWCYLVTIPLVAAALRIPRARMSLTLLLVASLVASFASSIRSMVGVPVLIVALMIGYSKSRKLTALRRAGLGLALAAAFLVVPYGVIPAVEKYRDHQLGVEFEDGQSSEHPFWHTLYIGLGYTDNKYGIYYNDSVAAQAVVDAAEESPPAYLSSAYERTLRRLYFDIARDDPAYVGKVYATKAGVTIADMYERFRWLFLIAPFAAIVGAAAGWYRRMLLLATPFLLMGMAPAIVAAPITEYEIGLFGALGTLWMLTLAAVFTSLREALPATIRVASSRTWRPGLREPAAERFAIAFGLGLLLFVAVSPVAAWAESPRNQSLELRSAATSMFSNSEPPATGERRATWSFNRSIPPEWFVVPPAAVVPVEGALRVGTSKARYGYQLLSPTFDLEPGEYFVDVDVDVTYGGIGVGVLDVANDKWIVDPVGIVTIDGGEHPREIYSMFSVDTRMAVRIVLMNWRAYDAASEWTLRRASVSTVLTGA